MKPDAARAGSLIRRVERIAKPAGSAVAWPVFVVPAVPPGRAGEAAVPGPCAAVAPASPCRAAGHRRGETMDRQDTPGGERAPARPDRAPRISRAGFLRLVGVGGAG